MLKVIVNGKTRIVRDSKISYHTNNDLYCKYKDHNITISKQEKGDFYVSVVGPDGMYAVNGGFGGEYCRYNIKTIDDCLAMCIENILIK